MENIIENNISIEEVELLKQGFTHGAKFHSDDIFATALLQIINPIINFRFTSN